VFAGLGFTPRGIGQLFRYGARARHWFGRLVLFGFTWALAYHTLGGLRHFLWDTGRGLEIKTVEWMARANLAGSIVITLLLWVIGYWVKP
jgi:succinate dehydrogenase / fumarate reductase cytochrome b subunit